MKFRGQVTIGLLGTVGSIVGGALIVGAWVVTYVQGQVAPVQAQTQQNQTAIAALSTKMDDTNAKVTQLYDYFLQRGLSTGNVRTYQVASTTIYGQ